MNENQKITLDYLYNESRKLPNVIDLNGCRIVIEYAKIREKNILGKTYSYNVIVSNEIGVKKRQEILFHELIHCLLVMYAPEQNTEENVRKIESEYLNEVTRLPKQVKI